MSKGLELVRRLASFKERDARRGFADAVADLRQAEANLAGLNNRREVLRQHLSESVTNGTAADHLAEAYRYISAFGMRVDQAAEACAERRSDAHKAEQEWMNSRRNLKGMDTVCERRAERERRERERREQVVMDDLYRHSPGGPLATMQSGVVDAA